MPLLPGARLGAYEVVCLIGAGGMGEVYQARDTRLDRIVAIKVLPEAFAGDSNRRERFEREARAAAALNHPHICDLHDVGEAASATPSASAGDTIRFLVMEHLDGHTLAERVATGRLPVPEALRYAVEIAGALDHAHQRGLLHRDLKPANVMLTATGAKLLDFGLSKPQRAIDIPSLATASPEDVQLTAPGALLGTFPYMAPEVLEGGDADARSDVFALGAIIYEMVAGQRPFQAQTAAGLIGAILHLDPPPLSTLEKHTPPALDHLVARCLAKNPGDRWQTARDLLLQLQWIERGLQTDAATARRRALRLIAVAAGVGLMIGTAVLMLASIVGRSSRVDALVRLTLSPPADLRPAEVAIAGPVTISPDGRRVVFAATGADGTQRLWVRELDARSAQPVNGTDGGAHPFWSPDGQSMGFFAQRKLKRARLGGGGAQTLCDAVLPRGGTWSQDGIIIFSAGAGHHLYRVSAQGGDAIALPPDGVNQERYWPSFLPDGRHFLYFGRPQRYGIYAASYESGEARLVLPDYISATYARPGYLVGMLWSARGAPLGTLMAHGFDPSRLALSGEAMAVAEQVRYDPNSAKAAFSVSQNGTLIYESVDASSGELVWLDRRGNTLAVVGGAIAYGHPALSPDEKTMVVERVDPVTHTQDLWVIDVSRDVASRFTSDPAIDFMPVVSPTGERVVFASARNGPPSLFQKPLLASTPEQSLLRAPFNSQPTHWSRDGRFILFARLDPRTQWDLWQLPLHPSQSAAVPVLQTEFSEHLGRLSPDGRWLAYVSDASGTNEVYVRAFPAAEAATRISINGGSEPRWRGDGGELFYLASDRRLMAVEVRNGAQFEAGPPAELFTIRIGSTRNAGYEVNYTVAHDGRRFLVSRRRGEPEPLRTNIVINWPAALKGG